MKKWRKILQICAAVLIVAVVITVTDTVVAIRVERHIASSVKADAGLEREPEVYAAGIPYIGGLITQKIPLITIESQDIEAPHLGLVNSRVELTDLKVTRQQLLSGDVVGASSKLVRNLLSLDGVAVGRHLNITDLTISNPYDISPAGGQASEATLTGTPPGFSEPVSVMVALRLRGDTFEMLPRQLIDAPAGHENKALNAFRWSFSTLSLPLSGPAESVYLNGGSIYFESERRNTTITKADLLPLH